MGVGSKPIDDRWIQTGPREWKLPAKRGWVIYTEAQAHYYDPDELEQAQADYEAAVAAGMWASRPQPAHTGQ